MTTATIALNGRTLWAGEDDRVSVFVKAAALLKASFRPPIMAGRSPLYITRCRSGRFDLWPCSLLLNGRHFPCPINDLFFGPIEPRGEVELVVWRGQPIRFLVRSRRFTLNV